MAAHDALRDHRSMIASFWVLGISAFFSAAAMTWMWLGHRRRMGAHQVYMAKAAEDRARELAKIRNGL